MKKVKISKLANHQLDAIYQYSLAYFGEQKADQYINDLLSFIKDLPKSRHFWRLIPARFEISGYYALCLRHYIFWSETNEHILIRSILHDRMDLKRHLAIVLE